MSKFNKGDRVQLNSGGPILTVADVGDYGPMGPKEGVKCDWFDDKTRVTEVFDEATLKPDTTMGRVPNT